jgi:hypothetical protein
LKARVPYHAVLAAAIAKAPRSTDRFGLRQANLRKSGRTLNSEANREDD